MIVLIDPDDRHRRRHHHHVSAWDYDRLSSVGVSQVVACHRDRRVLVLQWMAVRVAVYHVVGTPEVRMDTNWGKCESAVLTRMPFAHRHNCTTKSLSSLHLLCIPRRKGP